jgi:putative heme iron utilization protein
MQTIFMGYISLVHGKEMQKMDPEFEKAIKEIESTSGMSEAMKKQMIERLKATQKMMGGQQDAMQQSVHKLDLALIQPMIPGLKKLFEAED